MSKIDQKSIKNRSKKPSKTRCELGWILDRCLAALGRVLCWIWGVCLLLLIVVFCVEHSYLMTTVLWAMADDMSLGDVVSFPNSCKNISFKWTSEMIPLSSYCCKKPICNVSMIFHIPDIHCLCDGWRRILISTRRILRSDKISFAKINS